jgi:hypothetical protein
MVMAPIMDSILLKKVLRFNIWKKKLVAKFFGNHELILAKENLRFGYG